MKRFSFLAVVATITGFSAYAQSDSLSVKEEPLSKELQEVVVKGKNVWIEGNKIVFSPQKRAKNLATDATSLIDKMNTGLLRVNQGKIIAPDGQDVNIFINGVPADGMDLSTFWPKNALRVEYMQSSNDPRFQGKTNIVNFVMKDYVAGGLTKLSAYQEIPNSGDYSVSSKLVWGKMTYNAIFKGGYMRNHLSGSTMTETYRDIWYQGKHYDQIDLERDQDSYSRNNDMYGGFSARYRTEKTLITHEAGWQWNENPGGGSHGSIFYNPAVIESNRMETSNHGLNITPALGGTYFFTPNSKWNYGFSWNWKYSHNNNFSSYSDLETEPIETASRENQQVMRVGLSGIYNISKKMQLQAALSEQRTVSDAYYGGSVASHQWQSFGTSNLVLQWWYQPVEKFSIVVKPNLTLYDWNVNHDIKKTEWMPGVDFRAGWSINNKNYLSLSAWYIQKSPSSSMRSDVILRQTELKWIEGNPELKSSDFYWIDLHYYSPIFNWLTVNYSISYITESAESVLKYKRGGENYDGVIAEYVNAGRRNGCKTQLDVKVSLFEGKLSISNSLTYDLNSYSRMSTIGKWRVRPSIAWYFGNCYLLAYYFSPEKLPAYGGLGYTRTAPGYGLDFCYGNGNFNLDMDINAPFTKRLHFTDIYSGDVFSINSRNWSNGRSVSLRLTYTFDYGKKVEPNINIYEQNLQSTSVLGSAN